MFVISVKSAGRLGKQTQLDAGQRDEGRDEDGGGKDTSLVQAKVTNELLFKLPANCKETPLAQLGTNHLLE